MLVVKTETCSSNSTIHFLTGKSKSPETTSRSVRSVCFCTQCGLRSVFAVHRTSEASQLHKPREGRFGNMARWGELTLLIHFQLCAVFENITLPRVDLVRKISLSLGRSLGEGKGYPTPVFWPAEFQGLCSPWDHKESDMTEQISLSLSCQTADYLWAGCRYFSSKGGKSRAGSPKLVYTFVCVHKAGCSTSTASPTGNVYTLTASIH